ncbi:MAG: hypothetical protein L3J51_09335 [Cocleimonas sp.]|nr:hypothetical protein [Cocleimonas sp.]
MRIIGGNFGIKGSVWIRNRDKRLVIEGAQESTYSPAQILSVTANVAKEKKFGILGFIIGALLLSVVLGIFLNILGVIIALVIAATGSYYTEKSNIVEVKFNDGKAVSLDCSSRGVKKLIQFAPG